MNIVIVDDEISALHKFLDQILMVSKIEVNYKFFKNEDEGLFSCIVDHNIKAVFLDINLGSTNGLELAVKIHNIAPDVKFIFITGTNTKMEDVPEVIKDKTIDIIYKPIDINRIENILYELENKKTILKVTMFPHFDCFINNRLVVFSSSKAKELFALVLVHNGKSVTMETAITALWPDKEIEKAKISYRDAVWRLRQTLNEINFPCLTFLRAQIILNKENIECDYYDILDNKKKYDGTPLLSNYDWSLELESTLNHYKN